MPTTSVIPTSLPKPSHAAPRATSRRPRRHGQDGMALIEALVSMLIFAFGVLGLIGLEASAIALSGDAEDRTRASMFANEIATYMWNQNSVAIPAAQYTAWQTAAGDPSQPMGLPSGTLTITSNSAFTNSSGVVNAADITFTWVAKTDAIGTTAGATATTVTRQLTTRVILP